jgi:SAM-dependent methyltransferase
VALEHARRDVADCEFLDISDPAMAGRKFDFLFTHHVLEHVYDIDAVWQQIAGLMKPDSAMLHILPCGNAGSLEYRISRLVSEGFDPTRGNRFFFEDEGHLRRLDTAQMTEMAAAAGFALEREYYSHQYHGAVDWITRTAPRFAASLADPARARDEPARRELARLRRRLLPATVLRALLHRLRSFRRGGGTGLKRWAVLFAALGAYPVARLVDRRARREAEAEWRERNQDPRGSEMYLFFARRPGSS